MLNIHTHISFPSDSVNRQVARVRHIESNLTKAIQSWLAKLTARE